MWTPDSLERLAEAKRIQEAHDLLWASRLSEIYAEQGMINNEVYQAFLNWRDEVDYYRVVELEYQDELREQQDISDEEYRELMEIVEERIEREAYDEAYYYANIYYTGVNLDD